MQAATHSSALPPLAADYEITASQVARFRRDGFIVLRGVLDAEEIAAYGQAIAPSGWAP